jgi:hypothetical protein
MDYKEQAVAHAIANGFDEGFASSCPRAYWDSVRGVAAAEAKALVDKAANSRACQQTFADIWPSAR